MNLIRAQSKFSAFCQSLWQIVIPTSMIFISKILYVKRFYLKKRGKPLCEIFQPSLWYWG